MTKKLDVIPDLEFAVVTSEVVRDRNGTVAVYKITGAEKELTGHITDKTDVDNFPVGTTACVSILFHPLNSAQKKSFAGPARDITRGVFAEFKLNSPYVCGANGEGQPAQLVIKPATRDTQQRPAVVITINTRLTNMIAKAHPERAPA